MYLDEVTEVISYLNEHPTASEILAAVHEVKTSKKYKLVNEEDFNESFNEIPQILGTVPERPPSDFVQSIQFAEDMLKKLKTVN